VGQRAVAHGVTKKTIFISSYLRVTYNFRQEDEDKEKCQASKPFLWTSPANHLKQLRMLLCKGGS
jgi:hypothetical protein